MKELKKIENSLAKLKEEFNIQTQALSSDTKEFHNIIIDLSAKYPEHKELLQFIVFVNDKLETNQNIFKDIIIESLNDLIDNKATLVQEVIEQKNLLIGKSNNSTEDVSMFESLMNKIKTLKELKLIILSIAISLVALGVLFSPDVFLQILSAISALIL